MTIHFGEEDRKTTLQEVAQRTGKEVVVAPEVTQNAIRKVKQMVLGDFMGIYVRETLDNTNIQKMESANSLFTSI